MSLQFILGNCGSGKTNYSFKKVIEEASKNPKRNYLVIVPEQFTMSTQRKLVELSPNGAIMNIDVLSFKRLAYRVFDEIGLNDINILEETGKNLVLRKLASNKLDQLTVLRPNMRKIGYIDELKSLISELMQYNISPERLEAYADNEKMPANLRAKIKDVITMYTAFNDYLKDSYITDEQILQLLIRNLDKSEIIKDSVIVLDEFTGFTPVQNLLIYRLMTIARQIVVLLEIDVKDDFYNCKGDHELFSMTKKTIASLNKMAAEQMVAVDETVVMKDSVGERYKDNKPLIHLEQNLFRPWYSKYKEEQNAITIASLNNPYEELTYAARKINELVHKGSYRYKDFAVVTGALDSYSNYAEEVFGRYKIPYFMDQTTELLFNPFIESIRAAIEIAETNFSYESILRFLRCGFSGMEDNEVDILDNYLLATGIRGQAGWAKRWLKKPKGMIEVDLDKLDDIRIRLYDIFSPFYSAFAKDGCVCDKILALYKLISDFDMEKQLMDLSNQYLEEGRQTKSKIYEQIYRLVMNLLEKYYDLLKDEKVDIDEFSAILDAGMSAAKVAVIPPGFDSVTIGDIERTRLDGVKVLIFLGVNDGIIPKAKNRGGIISEYERQLLSENELTMAPSAKEEAFIQKFYLYRNLTKPSDKIFITYSRVDLSGQSMRPSYLIGVIRNIFPAIEVKEVESLASIFEYTTRESAVEYLVNGEKDDNWYCLANYLLNDKEVAEKVKGILEAPFEKTSTDMISRVIAHAIYGNRMDTSVTRLEQFASCAYSHFLKYGLILRERKEHGFATADMGNIYHDALERYGNNLRDSGLDWHKVNDEKMYEIAERSFDEALGYYSELAIYDKAATVHLIDRMKGIFKKTVWALTKQVKAGNFEPEKYEFDFSNMEDDGDLGFTLSGNEKVNLLGRIDRIDSCHENGSDHVKIIDYKSGSEKLDLSKIYEGISMQLVVYMIAAMKDAGKTGQAVPAGIFYYNIDDPVIELDNDTDDVKDLDDAILKALRPNGLVNEDERVYRLMDTDFEVDSLYIPLKIKKDGSPYANSLTATSDGMNTIMDYVGRKIKDSCEDIYAGQIKVNPYKDAKKDSCAYCKYSGVCAFDSNLDKDKTRTVATGKKEELIEKMQTEIALSKNRETK